MVIKTGTHQFKVTPHRLAARYAFKDTVPLIAVLEGALPLDQELTKKHEMTMKCNALKAAGDWNTSCRGHI